MIFETLQQSIVDRLLSDAWYTDPGREVKVLAEQPLSLQYEYQQAIARMGSVVIVAQPSITETDSVDRVTIALTLHAAENVTLNRGKGGSQKTGAESLVKAMALLRGWTPDENMWADFYFKGLTPIGEDEEGCYHHQLELYTYTMLELLLTLLGTESGIAIGDENNTPLIVSPTEP